MVRLQRLLRGEVIAVGQSVVLRRLLQLLIMVVMLLLLLLLGSVLDVRLRVGVRSVGLGHAVAVAAAVAARGASHDDATTLLRAPLPERVQTLLHLNVAQRR